jgi:autotransporter-associated beta strand protein
VENDRQCQHQQLHAHDRRQWDRGPGNLEKSGGSTLTLVGPNTYSGQTLISGGTLSIAAANSLGNASVTNSIRLGGGAA